MGVRAAQVQGGRGRSCQLGRELALNSVSALARLFPGFTWLSGGTMEEEGPPCIWAQGPHGQASKGAGVPAEKAIATATAPAQAEWHGGGQGVGREDRPGKG